MSTFFLNSRFFIWFFLLCGGLFHSLGYFKKSELFLVQIALVSLTTLTVVSWAKYSHYVGRLLLGVGLVFGLALVLEIVGVNFGVPFGDYRYNVKLTPAILGVPLIIGVAWVLVIFSSLAVVKYYSPSRLKLINVTLAALLVLVFDFFLEPAAYELRMWFFRSNVVPPQNYLTWFVAGFFLLFLVDSIVGPAKYPWSPKPFLDLYLAEVLYFIIVII